MRALVGGADCARAGVAIVLGGFARARAFDDVASGDDDVARSSRAVVDDFDDDFDDADARAAATPALGVARRGDDAFVAFNAQRAGADAARAALDAIDALDALAGDDALDEACFVAALRDDALERDAREVRDPEAFLAFEDARNGATPSRARGSCGGRSAREGWTRATAARWRRRCGRWRRAGRRRGCCTRRRTRWGGSTRSGEERRWR